MTTYNFIRDLLDLADPLDFQSVLHLYRFKQMANKHNVIFKLRDVVV